MDETNENTLSLDSLLEKNGPVCLIIEAHLAPVGGENRFQPAGFPQIGHVIYDAPQGDNGIEKVCIIDSAASMANHLESVCLANSHDVALHPDLNGLPYVLCVTDRNFSPNEDGITLDKDDKHDRPVTSTLREGHRIASDYFLDGLIDPQWDLAIEKPKEKEKDKDKSKAKKKLSRLSHYWNGSNFRSVLRSKFELTEIKKNEKYYTYPENWPSIFATIFNYDPNSLVHGVLFAKEQIKINRMLTAHMEAFGAKRVISSGVKFDPLGKTTSGQPIFSVDEETAKDIRATFIIDLALLRSYGRDNLGLNVKQKRLLLELALWKISHILSQPFAFRSNCRLQCQKMAVKTETTSYGNTMPVINICEALKACNFIEGKDAVTRVYYPADALFKVGKEEESQTTDSNVEVAEKSEE